MTLTELARYLAYFQADMRNVYTTEAQRKVERLYHHDRLMGRWRAYWDAPTQTTYARRVHKDTGAVQYQFPPTTSFAMRTEIQQRTSMQVALPLDTTNTLSL